MVNEYDKKKLSELFELIIFNQESKTSATYAIQEMSELIKVLTKHMLDNKGFTIERLIEELSHALLMIGVIKEQFQITDSQVVKEQIKALEKYKNEMNEV